jgi:hypothetical protein
MKRERVFHFGYLLPMCSWNRFGGQSSRTSTERLQHSLTRSSMELISQMPQLAKGPQQVLIEGIHLGIGRCSARPVHEHLHAPEGLNQATCKKVRALNFRALVLVTTDQFGGDGGESNTLIEGGSIQEYFCPRASMYWCLTPILTPVILRCLVPL